MCCIRVWINYTFFASYSILQYSKSIHAGYTIFMGYRMLQYVTGLQLVHVYWMCYTLFVGYSTAQDGMV
jgi:hypothetical protein